jgi:hypothetical protein
MNDACDCSNQLLVGAPLFYPSAREWMWNYCIYLGPFTDERGHNYDLGIFISNEVTGLESFSAAIVYGNTPGNYLSGSMKTFYYNDKNPFSYYTEVYNRMKLLGLYKEP